MASTSISPYPSPPDSSSRTQPTTTIGRRNPKDEQQAPSSCAIRPEPPTPRTSPTQSAQEVSADGKQPAQDKKNKHASDLRSLRIRLDLDRWKCGSRTKTTGKPCNSRVTARQQVAALAKMQSLIPLTQASHTLEAKLRELAGIVHCPHHNYGVFLGYRVEKWTAVFPPGDADVEKKPAALVGVEIEKLLGESLSVFCAGINVDDKPCRNRMGGRKVQNCSKTIREIVRPEIYSDDSELDYFLKVLAENMYCRVHKSQGLQQVGIWKSEIIARVRDEKKSSESPVMKDSDDNNHNNHTPKGHQNQDSDSDSDSTKTSPSSQNTTIDSSPSSHTTSPPRTPRSSPPAKFWPEEYNTTPFDILPTPHTNTNTNTHPSTQNQNQNHHSPLPTLQSLLLTPLQKEEQTPGFLYAYEVPGNKGLIKIGYTTRTIQQRHDEWSFDCNRVIRPIYPPPLPPLASALDPDPGMSVPIPVPVPVPNAARVEKLVHAELRSRNVRVYCTGCLKPHVEWFGIEAEEAVSVIGKWVGWMSSGPYLPGLEEVEVGGEGEGEDTWVLKPEEERRVKGDIYRFVKGLERIPNV